jgi:hypothetical protein
LPLVRRSNAKRIPHDLQCNLDLWRDEEAGLLIETIAAACALIA